MSRTSARTFSEALRSRGPDRLTTLLELRADLTFPPPHDLADLAARASAAPSVGRALGRVDAWHLAVLQALAAEPDPTDVAALGDLLGVTERSLVRAAVADLRDLALVWGEDDALHLLREVRVALGPFPGGLAQRTGTDHDGLELTACLAGLDPAARQVLDRLVWGPPTGAVRDARQRVGDGTTLGELLRRGLLVVHETDTVLMPRHVALALRHPPRLLRDLPPPTVPRPTVAAVRSGASTDTAAIGAAFELVQDVAAVAELLAAGRYPVLRDGGLGVRDLGHLSAGLAQSVPRTALVLEIAHAAGLINAAANRTVLPTAAFDGWVASSGDQRWQALLRGWRQVRRWFARSLDRGHHVLGAEASLRSAPEIRAVAMECLSAAPGAPWSTDDLIAAVGWSRPGWATGAQWPLDDLIAELWIELTALGLIARGTTTSLAAIAGDPDAALPASVAEQFPAPVTELIVQADLTAVAPGPLRHDVAVELALLADPESRGAGGVHRFSARSLRRAFDAGWSHEEIRSWLSAHSRTPVPQPLDYLIADTARLYGSVRVGHAWSYIRTEDDTQAAALLRHADAGQLGLRRLAPGVLVASAEPDEVVAVLRELGLHPAAEDETGHTISAPPPLRAGPVPVAEPPVRLSAGGAVTHLLANERRQAAVTASTEDLLSALTRAQRDGLAVDVSYVDAQGTRSSVVAAPIAIASGSVRFARTSGGALTVPLARIQGAIVQEGPAARA